VELDRTDIGILRALQKDGRQPNKVLAATVGLAPSSCHERVKRLIGSGILAGVHGTVDPAAFGIGIQALLMIELAKHDRKAVETFQDDILRLAEVSQIFLVTGGHDFIVHVAVRDMTHLRDLVLDAITIRPEVVRIETAIIYDHARAPTLPCYLPAAAGAAD
jgi:DNA-binding Lrp family transcriptional regulator